jgi:hypothetical protein
VKSAKVECAEIARRRFAVEEDAANQEPRKDEEEVNPIPSQAKAVLNVVKGPRWKSDRKHVVVENNRHGRDSAQTIQLRNSRLPNWEGRLRVDLTNRGGCSHRSCGSDRQC